jgi:hypothetical protein
MSSLWFGFALFALGAQPCFACAFNPAGPRYVSALLVDRCEQLRINP